MSNADLARFIDRYTVEYVRTYPHPIERVWRAVTEPGELAQWFIPPSVWELKSGGAYRFHDDAFWRAITDPAEMSVWFGPIAFEPRLGGAYRGLWEEPSMFQGVITAFEPPRLLRFGGPHPGADAHWQFELEPADSGTRMVFVQRIPPGHEVLARWPLDPPESAPDTPWRPGTLSGWHSAFDGLADVLDGVAVGSRPHERGEALTNAYREHMRATMP